MLYNPNWQPNDVKSGPPTLAGMIAWLEKQPADKEYTVNNPRTCLMGQYWGAVALMGRTYPWTVEVIYETPRTCGAALARARALVKWTTKNEEK